MKLTNGKQTRFVLDIFKNPDGDFKLYVSLSGRGVSYEPVEDISFDNGTMRVVVGSGKKVYEGKIVGDGLKLWGEWGKYSGTFFLEIKE